MGESPAYSLRRVAAAASLQRLIIADVALPEPAQAVLEVRRTVLIDQTAVLRGHVLLSGRLRLTYTYTARTGDGSVKALTCEQPFPADLAAPEAEPDMEVRLVEAHVTDAQIAIHALDPQGGITALRDYSIVQLTVRLLREEVVSPPAGPSFVQIPSRAAHESAAAEPSDPPILIRPFRFTQLHASKRSRSTSME